MDHFANGDSISFTLRSAFIFMPRFPHAPQRSLDAAT